MFASTSLAARIEAAECRLLSDSALVAARRRPGSGVFAMPLAGGMATFAAPGSPLNKVAGLGFGGPIDEAELDAIERAFAARGAAVQVELSSLGDPAVAVLLSQRDYLLRGFENLLGRQLDASAAPTGATDVDVRPSGAEELPAWLDTLITAFAEPDTQGVPSHESFARKQLEETIPDTALAEGFHRYLARRAGVPVGAAGMRLADGVAQLCGAATLRPHRRRGVQTALTAARLRAAADAGCDVAVVTTSPGSKSQQNAQRQGFALLYTRAILVRSAPARG